MAEEKKCARPLPPKQERFCSEYIVDLNGAQAAIRAGYSQKTAKEQAHRLLNTPAIKRQIDDAKLAQQKRTEISADTILRELLRLATVDVTQAFDEKGWLKDLKDIPEDVRRAISAIETSELFTGDGDQKHIGGINRKVRFYDKIRPLELLGKHVKLFAERIEHSGPDGKPIETRAYGAMTDEQLDAKINAILTKGKTP